MNGDVVSYVVTRNINYTNICSFKCQFCAFSKGKMSENLRGRPYDLNMREVADRVIEAWQRGASEVCMQGGIHPSYTGQKYLDICRTVKDAVPQIHMHAFSPLEISHGAATLGISVCEFLQELKAAYPCFLYSVFRLVDLLADKRHNVSRTSYPSQLGVQDKFCHPRGCLDFDLKNTRL